MSGEPKTLTPQAMTLEEAILLMAQRDRVLTRDEVRWWVQDKDPTDSTKARPPYFRATWPRAVSVVLGVRVVARDEAAELRAAAREFFEAEDAVAALHGPNGTYTGFHEAADIANAARENLRRLAGGESEK